MTSPRYVAVDSVLAGFEQYLELEQGDDGLWWVTRQVDVHADGSWRYGRGALSEDERGMLSDRPSSDAELADDEFSTTISGREFEEIWQAAARL
ncbi:hypothetical protein [Microbacterium sp. NPDC057650]|uniref:hypothetical protein n=1 Tax=unclassified Microbacterium TaxID=2609290 RepID=UPI0036732D82